MVKITVTGPDEGPKRQRNVIEPLVLDDLPTMQESQTLDFKRSVEMDKDERKSKLIDDIVAFLNRGAARILIGVEEKQGRFDSFRPMPGDADKFSLGLQTMILDKISPMPIDVQVVPIHVDGGFIIDIQIPRHRGGPYMNRFTGGYLIRTGASNRPIDAGMLRSSFVDELAWMTRLDELTQAEDARLAENRRMVTHSALRIGILPREHFDYHREPFSQDSHYQVSAPRFHDSSAPFFKSCEDGHEAYSYDFDQRGTERLFVRDDWFVHAYAGYTIGITQGDQRLMLGEFDEAFEQYMQALAAWFAEQKIGGPFAVTLAVQSLNETEGLKYFFPRGAAVRTLRPRLVEAVDDPELMHHFKRQVRQASVYG
jgi:Putative DNA-binding domain